MSDITNGSSPANNIFVSGGTGYIGQRLIQQLVARGHAVKALARPGSEDRLPAGCTVVKGNALDARSFGREVPDGGVMVHLVGVAHPAPWKEKQFRAIDFVALQSSVAAAIGAQVRHFVFVSVAHPAPAMKAYIRVRSECEQIIRNVGLTATILRPWYVLGPGHWWPVMLKPMYALAEKVPATREGALRLGLVTVQEMVGALTWAVEHPGRQILEVPRIRELGSYTTRPRQAIRATSGA